MNIKDLRFEEDREPQRPKSFTDRVTIPCPRCRDRAYEKQDGKHICFSCGWEG